MGPHLFNCALRSTHFPGLVDKVCPTNMVGTKMSLQCSIIICTFDRAKLLEKAIRSASQQDYPVNSVEILVIDNDPSQSAQSVVQRLTEECPFSLRYISENKRGLSHARNTGIRSAIGEIVIFLDDDACPQSPNWVKNLAQAFNDRQVAAAGGDIEPIWEGEKKPDWLHPRLLAPLSATSFKQEKITPLQYPLYPWGANIAFRKTDISAPTPFLTSLGYTKDQTMVPGEESELCLRLEKEGKKIVYVPNASVKHFTPNAKLTNKWFKNRGYGQGISFARIDRMHGPKTRILKNLTYNLTLLGLCPVFAIVTEILRLRKYATLFRYLNQRAKGYIQTINQ